MKKERRKNARKLPFTGRRIVSTKGLTISFTTATSRPYFLISVPYSLCPPLLPRFTSYLRTELQEANLQKNLPLLSIVLLFLPFIQPSAHCAILETKFFVILSIFLSSSDYSSKKIFLFFLIYFILFFFLVFTFLMPIILISVVRHFVSSISLVLSTCHIFVVVCPNFFLSIFC